MSTSTLVSSEMSVDERIDALATGRLRLYRWGRHVRTRITDEQRARFEAARWLGYLDAKGSERTLRALWCHWCDIARVPDVLVTRCPRWSRVRLDMLPCDRDLAEWQTLCLSLNLAEFVPGRARGAAANVGRSYVQLGHIPPDRIAYVAATLVQVSKMAPSRRGLR